MKRGYLLPPGGHPLPRSDGPFLPFVRDIVIPEQTTVEELAVLLHLSKFRIIADLMKLNVFLTISQTPDYETIIKVAQMHGHVAKRAP